MNVIVILGSPNTDDGLLSEIAIGRCEKAIEIYRQKKNQLFVLAGGWGDHFNTAQLGHADFLEKYLFAQRIRPEAILSKVYSSNTLEDARLSYNIIKNHPIEEVIVITSDFHVERAKYIFEAVYINGVTLTFKSCITNKESTQINFSALLDHEKKALQHFRKSKLGHL